MSQVDDYESRVNSKHAESGNTTSGGDESNEGASDDDNKKEKICRAATWSSEEPYSKSLALKQNSTLCQESSSGSISKRFFRSVTSQGLDGYKLLEEIGRGTQSIVRNGLYHLSP